MSSENLTHSLWHVKNAYEFDPKYIIDIGACSGTYGLYGLYKNPQLRYLLIEPLEEFNSKLTKHMGNNKHEIFNCALSDEEGVSFFKVDENAPDSSHIVFNESLETSTSSLVKVPTKTLDSLIKDSQGYELIGEEVLIKIDVQGAELQVVKGSLSTLKNNNCLVVIEIGMSRNDNIKIFSEMDSLGYRLIDCIDFVRFQGAQRVTSQFDAVFIK
jgi:FkbM family methyltransferase